MHLHIKHEWCTFRLFFFLAYLDLLDEESKSDDLEDSKAETEEGLHDFLLSKHFSFLFS